MLLKVDPFSLPVHFIFFPGYNFTSVWSEHLEECSWRSAGEENLDVGWRQRQYTFWTAIMIFWGLIHTSLWISLDKNGLFGKVRVFEGKHSQDWAEIAENEEICDLHDKNGGLRFFWQLVHLNYALVSQMGCLELFIFENGQPMTTPPPKVYFWAFRLTVWCELNLGSVVPLAMLPL